MLPWIWNNHSVINENCFLLLLSNIWKMNLFKNASAIFGIVIDVDCIKKLKLYLALKVIWIVILRRDVRVCFTKLRLSRHRFLVERARWLKVKVPYTQRTCTLRNSNDIEDEYHGILACKYFRDVRKKYIKPFYYQRRNMMKFLDLMTSVSMKNHFRLMLFLKVVFKLYAQTLWRIIIILILLIS